jgi:ATP-dependent 26S proteasome regulatory subunit
MAGWAIENDTDEQTVRLLREELGLLQQPGSYVGEVVKVMGSKRVLVKVHPEGKYGISFKTSSFSSTNINEQSLILARALILRNSPPANVLLSSLIPTASTASSPALSIPWFLS